MKLGFRKISVLCFGLLLLSGGHSARAQFVDNIGGLLIMPSAEMEEMGTFMLSSNFLSKRYTASPTWDYNTLGYGVSVVALPFLEFSYCCTIFNGKWDPNATTERAQIMRNQDRHFAARLRAVKEGQFWNWMPQIVLGVSDPTSGSNGDYITGDKVNETGNGYFNRYYIAATKHFNTAWGKVGAHAAFQYTVRADFMRTGPCAAVTWNPVWLNKEGSFLSGFRLIAEYDARDVNVGMVASIWKNHFEAMACLEGGRWFTGGLRFKYVIQ